MLSWVVSDCCIFVSIFNSVFPERYVSSEPHMILSPYFYCCNGLPIVEDKIKFQPQNVVDFEFPSPEFYLHYIIYRNYRKTKIAIFHQYISFKRYFNSPVNTSFHKWKQTENIQTLHCLATSFYFQLWILICILMMIFFSLKWSNFNMLNSFIYYTSVDIFYANYNE